MAGLRYLAEQQNDDGGWGDTDKSESNLATTMLARAAFQPARLPADMELFLDWDGSVVIDEALKEVVTTLLEASLIVILVIFLFPFWYAAGTPGQAPKLEKPKNAKFCVESTEWMRAATSP